MKRRAFIQDGLATSLAGLGLAGYVPMASAQVTGANDAINKAGRQRMLSQRMAKSYMALGLQVVISDAERTLASSIALFDRQLVELKVYAPSQDIRTAYQQLEAKWSDYKAALVGKTPSKQLAPTVLTLSTEVLLLANEGTLLLERFSGRSLGRMVNLAGRQRMLSQRMASHYLAASWGIDPQRSLAEMNKAREEFVLAMQTLKAAPENNPRITQELVLAEQQFVFFSSALKAVGTSSSDKKPQTEVFFTSERILQVMDNITGFYSQIT